jgi:hypothetical protein
MANIHVPGKFWSILLSRLMLSLLRATNPRVFSVWAGKIWVFGTLRYSPGFLLATWQNWCYSSIVLVLNMAGGLSLICGNSTDK